MARIRSVHPGQWTDERFVTTSPMARLLAIGLRNEADDNGIFEWKPLQLKMRLFPADNCDVPDLLEELSATGQVLRYEVAGRPFGIIRNFTKYQSPKYPTFYHPVPAVIPEGYALHPKYLEKLDEQKEGHSGSESDHKGEVSPSTSPALPQHSGNRRAEGEERRGEDSRGEGQKITATGKKPAPSFSAADAELAGRMLQAIQRIAPSAKGGDKWAEDIRLMRERDKRSHAEIWSMFEFVQTDSFWPTVILSPGKLRQKWPQLEARRNQSLGKSKAPKPDNFAGREYTGTPVAEIDWMN